MLLLQSIQVKAQSLEEYLGIAVENSPSLQAAYKAFEVSTKQEERAKALPDPKVSTGIFISPIETRLGAQQARFSLSQTLPWFGTLEAKEAVAKHKSDEKYQAFALKKRQLLMEVKQAYYPLYEVNRQIEFQEENMRLLQTYQEQVQSLMANAKASLGDALRIEMAIDEALTKIELLKAERTTLEANFKLLLNTQNPSPIVVSDSLAMDIPVRLTESLAAHPEVSLMEKKIAVLDAQQALVEKSAKPQFSLGLDYALISPRTDVDLANNGRNALMPMVSMSIPIAQKKYRVEQEEISLGKEGIQHSIQAAKNELQASYSTVLFQLQKQKELYQLYQRQSEKTAQILNLLYTDYGNSGASFEELLRTQQQLLQYKMAKATATAQFHIALAQLSYLTQD